MEPDFRPGDYLLVLRWGEPQSGEAVVARHPETGEPVLKRLTGKRGAGMWLEGDSPLQSTDSRHFGPVSRSGLVGRVWNGTGI